MDSALTLAGVSKRFGTFTAVNQLSLTVPKGCIYGFLGQNGAGKTTTIRMVMSILAPDAGQITVLGQAQAAVVKDRLGYLPEEKGLYKKMKTAEIVAYFGRLKGMSASTANQKARELLTRYGLAEWLDKRCETMSKGMGQKVQVLGTIIHEPELVILDEPFSGLDPVNRDLMRDVILDMKRQGKTVIFSTHGMEHAEQICDYVMMIHKGQLQFAGTLAEVKHSEERTIRLDFDGDGSALLAMPMAARINNHGQHAEINLRAGASAQDALMWLAQHVTVRRFDQSEVSLHELFVRTVEQANRSTEVRA